MKTVSYTLEKKSKLTSEEIQTIKAASKIPPLVCDNCPELTAEQMKNFTMPNQKQKLATA